jgi:hypothetical protein
MERVGVTAAARAKPVVALVFFMTDVYELPECHAEPATHDP